MMTGKAFRRVSFVHTSRRRSRPERFGRRAQSVYALSRRIASVAIVLMLIALLALLTAAARALTPAQVLVVYNSSSDQSIALAAHYCSARAIPAQNRLAYAWKPDASGDDTATGYEATLFDQAVRAKAAAVGADCIVLCRNLPFRRYPSGSIDSYIAGDRGITAGARYNPYYSRTDAFSHKVYGVYVVCRLDGRTYADAAALVDRAIGPATDSPVLIDVDTASTGERIGWCNRQRAAAATLGALARLDNTPAFVGGSSVGGYFSWGSNDHKYNAVTYSSITFAGRGIALTAVSTSARCLRYVGGSSQSQIATLVSNGAMACIGDVTEPYLANVAHPDILAARWWTLRMQWGAASLSSTPIVSWTTIWVGDPLAAVK